jgi:hypothetical protein
MNYEDELAMVTRHVHEGEALVARQAEIVAKFAKAGHDTDMAENLLANFQFMQAAHCAHLARLLAQEV